MKDLEKILKALANQRRSAILKLLKDKEELIVGDLACGIKLSFKSTSRHLSVLLSVGIVEREQRGPEMFYKIAKDKKPVLVYIMSLL